MGNSVPLTKKTSIAPLKRHALYVGLQARVAKSLGVNRSVVCRVMKGQKTSKRVSTALLREVNRIERQLKRELERTA